MHNFKTKKCPNYYAFLLILLNLIHNCNTVHLNLWVAVKFYWVAEDFSCLKIKSLLFTDEN